MCYLSPPLGEGRAAALETARVHMRLGDVCLENGGCPRGGGGSGGTPHCRTCVFFCAENYVGATEEFTKCLGYRQTYLAAHDQCAAVDRLPTRARVCVYVCVRVSWHAFARSLISDVHVMLAVADLYQADKMEGEARAQVREPPPWERAAPHAPARRCARAHTWCTRARTTSWACS